MLGCGGNLLLYLKDWFLPNVVFKGLRPIVVVPVRGCRMFLLLKEGIRLYLKHNSKYYLVFWVEDLCNSRTPVSVHDVVAVIVVWWILCNLALTSRVHNKSNTNKSTYKSKSSQASGA